MCRIILLFVVVTFIFGCSPKKLITKEIAKEKKAIETVAINYNKLLTTKNTEAILKLFSDSPDFIFIGTDSAEVMKDKNKFKSHLEIDWQLLEITKIGDLRNVSILLSNDGELASMLYEVPWDMKFGGQIMHTLVRFAMTMIKENNDWHIIQGLGQMATVGQSSEDMLAQMKKAKK